MGKASCVSSFFLIPFLVCLCSSLYVCVCVRVCMRVCMTDREADRQTPPLSLPFLPVPLHLHCPCRQTDLCVINAGKRPGVGEKSSFRGPHKSNLRKGDSTRHKFCCSGNSGRHKSVQAGSSRTDLITRRINVQAPEVDDGALLLGLLARQLCRPC